MSATAGKLKIMRFDERREKKKYSKMGFKKKKKSSNRLEQMLSTFQREPENGRIDFSNPVLLLLRLLLCSVCVYIKRIRCRV